MGKPNNFNVFGSNKAKGHKQDKIFLEMVMDHL
jgi:hypothetical protein